MIEKGKQLEKKIDFWQDVSRLGFFVLLYIPFCMILIKWLVTTIPTAPWDNLLILITIILGIIITMAISTQLLWSKFHVLILRMGMNDLSGNDARKIIPKYYTNPRLDRIFSKKNKRIRKLCIGITNRAIEKYF